MSERLCVRESVCVYVCVREIEIERECERKRKRDDVVMHKREK